MHKRLFFRVLIALMALAMFTTACGADDSTDTATDSEAADSGDQTADSGDQTADSGDQMADGDEMAMDDGHTTGGGHGHGTGHEVSADLPTPSLELQVTEDPRSGWNIHATPIDHTLSPSTATSDHVDGEGHMHLYVDGEKVTRLYSEWFHLKALTPGNHEVRVELSSNNHSALTLDGNPIDETVLITQSESDTEHAHGGSDGHETADQPLQPSVRVLITEDPASGWAINAIPNEHEINPFAASTEHVEGEGHMHLYVDGEKIARLYGEWYYLAPLTEGDHEIRIELSGNDHLPLLRNGVIIDDTITVTQPADTAAEMAMTDTTSHDTHGDDHEMSEASAADVDGADTVLNVSVEGPTITGDIGRQEVAAGSTVAIVVSADAHDEVHVHGYDLLAPVHADTDAVFVFEADIPGLFEVELEGAGTLLLELLVS